MEKLGNPLDLDKYIGKGRNRIYRIGIELEGGWEALPKGTQLAHDGSVHVDAPFVGELPSPPLSMDKFEAWMHKYYPQHVNETCGMHVHFSFQTAFTYQRLMTPNYPATIVAYVTKWAKEDEKLDKNHCIYPRLDGKSMYCQHHFSADEQVRVAGKDFSRDREGNRYSVINYCWSRYNTLECRLLPMMQDSDQAIRAIRNLINVTNAFLVATAKREPKVDAGVTVEDEFVREFQTVRA